MSSNTYQSSLDQETSILTILTVSEVAEYLGVGKNSEYYGAAEPLVRCGESHLSGLTEPPHFVY